MKYQKITVYLVFFLSSFLAPAITHAETVGVLTYIEGRVDGTKDISQGYKPYAIEEKVSAGDTLRTKSYSKAEVTLADGSILRLGENSQVLIKDLSVDDLGFRKTAVINLERGSVRAIVAKTKNNAPFDILTPNSSGTVKGSDIYVSFLKSSTSVLVDEGVFTAINPAFPDKSVVIGEGKVSNILFNALPEEPRDFLPVELENMQNVTSPTIRELDQSTLKNADTTLATIVKITGTVLVTPYGSGTAHTPIKNEVLNAGDKIETGTDGRIEISLGNGHLIELRANTYLVINILKRDPKSGAYENLFECKFGKIRAKLQKIQQGSSFQVKTPTAVCGVRGTIMYLVVTPTNTTGFYEGGTGYMTGNDGNTQDVPPGFSSSAGEDGGVSDPSETSDDQRQEFGSDWGSDAGSDGEYGYSNPDGSSGGEGFGGEGGEGGDVLNGEGGAVNNDFNDLFDKPLTEDDTTDDTTGNEEEPIIPDVTIPTNYTGNFFPGDFDPVSNYLEGTGTLTVNGGAWAGTGSAVIGGIYAKSPNNDRYVGFGEISSGSSPENNGNFYGWLTASGGAEENTWVGYTASIYVDDTGDYGTITGHYDGTHELTSAGGNYPDIGEFGGIAEALVITAKESGGEMSPSELDKNILKNDFEGSLKGFFEGETGNVSSDDVTFRLANLTGADWGIWGLYTLGLGGRDGDASSDNWDLSITCVSHGDSGSLYWLGRMDGSENGDNGAFLGGSEFLVFTPLHGEGTDPIKYLIGGLNGEHSTDEYSDDWVTAGTGVWDDVNTMTDLTDVMKLTYHIQEFDLYDRINQRIENHELVLAFNDNMEMSGYAYFNDDPKNHEIGISLLSVGLYTYDPYYYSEGLMLASVSGSFTVLGSDQWTIYFSDNPSGANWIKFSGLKFSDGVWCAVIDGYMYSKDVAGVASGSYWFCSSDLVWYFYGYGVGAWAEPANNAGSLEALSFINEGYDEGGFYNYINGEEDFTLTTTKDFWPGKATASLGGYTSYENSSYNQENNSFTFITEVSGEANDGEWVYYGWLCGSNQQQKGTWSGPIALLFVDPDKNKGIILGDLSGTYYPNTDGSWIRGGADGLDVIKKGTTCGNDQYIHNYSSDAWMSAYIRGGEGYSISDKPSHFNFANFYEESYYDCGGCFGDSGGYQEIHDKWGIWAMTNLFWGAPYTSIGTLDMTLYGSDEDGMIYLGKITGDDSIKGDLKALAFDIQNDSIKYMKGKPVGEHYDTEDGEEWKISSSGDWVEVTELVNFNELVTLTSQLSSRIDELTQAAQLVEVCRIDFSGGQGNFMDSIGNITSATISLNAFIINFVAESSDATQGLWNFKSIENEMLKDTITGTFQGTPTDNWAVSITEGANIINFSGLQFSDNQWAATVNGCVDAKDIVGTASGAYDSATGIFSGAGVGAWQVGQEGPE